MACVTAGITAAAVMLIVKKVGAPLTKSIQRLTIVRLGIIVGLLAALLYGGLITLYDFIGLDLHGMLGGILRGISIGCVCGIGAGLGSFYRDRIR